MTTSEAIVRYNFITKVLLQNGNDELSKELKVKVMTMRIELSKIKKVFDEDSKAFVEQIVTQDFRNLAQKPDKTEEEAKSYSEQEAKLNEAYAEYILQIGNKEVDFDITFTKEEYNEILLVNCSNNINMNGNEISAGDFLEILYTLFVKE